MTNWVVGKVYKDGRGKEYTYVGPFIKTGGRLGAAFSGCMFENSKDVTLCMRNADGTTDGRIRDYDISDGSPTMEEREQIISFLVATGNFFSKSVVAADWIRNWQDGDGNLEKAEKVLEIIREIKNA